MERLTHATELLDGPLDEPATLDGNLRDLRRINRWLGGVALSAAAIEALAAHRAELTLLDVGTGGADIPAALVRLARTRRRRIHAVGIDSRPEILAAALRVRAGAATEDAVELHVGDGRRLGYADRSFDVAHASLVLHHLDPPGAVDLLREMGRVTTLPCPCVGRTGRRRRLPSCMPRACNRSASSEAHSGSAMRSLPCRGAIARTIWRTLHRTRSEPANDSRRSHRRIEIAIVGGGLAGVAEARRPGP